jgi:hypothetical protein
MSKPKYFPRFNIFEPARSGKSRVGARFEPARASDFFPRRPRSGDSRDGQRECPAIALARPWMRFHQTPPGKTAMQSSNIQPGAVLLEVTLSRLQPGAADLYATQIARLAALK